MDINGFRYISDTTGLDGPLLISLHDMCGESYDRNVPVLLMHFQPAGDLVTVNFGKGYIHQNQAWSFLLRLLQRILSVNGLDHLISSALQHFDNEFTVILIVINDQYFSG